VLSFDFEFWQKSIFSLYLKFVLGSANLSCVFSKAMGLRTIYGLEVKFVFGFFLSL
jgi:hypothetical protein